MSRSHVVCAALFSAAALAACGGNPTGSSGAVVLRGTVVGDASVSVAASASAARSSAGAARITVTVQEDPSLSATVGGNGTFELSGLPEGSFTLVFTSNGTVLGTIEITGAEAGQEIRITVQVTTTTVILIDIVNGGGDDDDGEDDDGDEDDGDEDDGDEDGDRTCAISGGKTGQQIQLEGHVQSGDASGFEIRVNGNRVKNGARVEVTTSGASFKCNGKPTATECRSTVKDGAKVHVSGTLSACDMSSATVAAREVKVQKP
jgi:hypothetical protein